MVVTCIVAVIAGVRRAWHDAAPYLTYRVMVLPAGNPGRCNFPRRPH